MAKAVSVSCSRVALHTYSPAIVKERVIIHMYYYCDQCGTSGTLQAAGHGPITLGQPDNLAYVEVSQATL